MERSSVSTIQEGPLGCVQRGSLAQLFWYLAWVLINFLLALTAISVLSRLFWPTHWYAVGLPLAALWLLTAVKSRSIPIGRKLVEFGLADSDLAKAIAFVFNFLFFTALLFIEDAVPGLKLSLTIGTWNLALAVLGGFLFALGMLAVDRPKKKAN